MAGHELEDLTALVRLRAEAALVRRLNAGYGFADSRIPSELYLRDHAARMRLGHTSVRPEDTHVAQAEEIDHELSRLEQYLEKTPTRFDSLVRTFDLSQPQAALLAAAVAYEMDRDVRELCHRLAGARREALYVDVVQEFEPEVEDSSVALAALHPNGTLRQWALVELVTGAEGTATLACSFGPSRRVLDWLLGDDRIDTRASASLHMETPGATSGVYLAEQVRRRAVEVAKLLSTGATSPMVLVQGPPGMGHHAVAECVAAEIGRPLAYVPLSAALLAPGQSDRIRLALAEIRLRGAVPYLSDASALTPSDNAIAPEVPQLIAHYPGPLVISTTERGAPSLPIRRPFQLIANPAADLSTREAAWSAAFSACREPSEVPDDAAAQLAGRYVIGPGTIDDVVTEATAFAGAAGLPLRLEHVEEAVGRRLQVRLGRFGSLVTRRARFAEMVVPDDVRETLRDLLTMVRERGQILERWGYARHLGITRGVSALFSGEPGTGKSMAASVISGELSIELMRIDLSAVVSKWVGETEKHLSQIFDEAQNANAMLLFDEADSLFGKRTETKSAQDRYANLEVNYILQRMETFDGICILTTNFEGSIDKAFLRRLNFRVRFPEPDVEERMALWRTLLPPETGIADQVDFRALAERFVMTGGHIKNAVVRAAVIAAREGRALSADDLMAGGHYEYEELGKVTAWALK